MLCDFPPKRYFYICFSLVNVPQYRSVFEEAFHCPGSEVGVLQIVWNAASSSGSNLRVALMLRYSYTDTQLRTLYKAHFSFLFLQFQLKLFNTKEATENP